MNKYGKHAMETWQAIAPAAYARIEDPMVFFQELGEQANDQVLDLIPQLAGPDPADESYLGKVGRLNAAKLQAEEIVREELLTPAPEDRATETDDEVEDSQAALTVELLQDFHREMRQGAPTETA